MTEARKLDPVRSPLSFNVQGFLGDGRTCSDFARELELIDAELLKETDNG